MKSLIALFTITSAFFLMSCSNVDHNGIGLTLLDKGTGLGDSFVEITSTEGSFVTFIDVPTNQKIFIPYNGDWAITSVNFYSMQN